MEPIKVAGNSYYVPSTAPSMCNLGLFKGYVIDPGSIGYDDLGKNDIHTVLISHGHTDHFRRACEFREKGARVIASKDDALLVRNPEVNIRGLFSWAKPPMEMVTLFFQGDACEVDQYIEEWKDSSIYSVPLPGHTLGEYGFITEDGVFYSSDSLYSEQIWGKYKLPYSIDRDMCEESLNRIKTLDFDHVVPGHGSPLNRAEAIKAADYHIEALQKVDDIILELAKEPISTEDLVTAISNKMGLYKSINNYWLTVVMLKGHLSSLINKGKVMYKLENYCMYWYRA